MVNAGIAGRTSGAAHGLAQTYHVNIVGVSPACQGHFLGAVFDSATFHSRGAKTRCGVLSCAIWGPEDVGRIGLVGCCLAWFEGVPCYGEGSRLSGRDLW
jgi:hypothetical protein